MSVSVAMVTGGAGFIGRRLVNELIASGSKVIVVDALLGKVHRPDSPEAPPTWPEALRSHERNGDAILWFGDIRDPESMQRAFACASRTWGELPANVYHLAAEVSVSQAETRPAMFFSANVTGSAVLIEVLQDVYPADHAPLVYYASSMSVYGSFYRKGVFGDCPEPNPVGMYGLSKLQPEAMFKMWAERNGGRLIIGRFFNVFGPGQSAKNGYTGVMANFIGRLILGLEPVVFGDGLAARSFIHVDDVVKSILASCSTMAQPDRMRPYTYDVCNGTVLTVKELVKLLLANEALVARFAEVKGADHGQPWFITMPERRGDVKLACSRVAGAFCTKRSTESLLKQIDDFATSLAKDDDFVAGLRAGGVGTLVAAVEQAALATTPTVGGDA